MALTGPEGEELSHFDRAGQGGAGNAQPARGKWMPGMRQPPPEPAASSPILTRRRSLDRGHWIGPRDFTQEPELMGLAPPAAAGHAAPVTPAVPDVAPQAPGLAAPGPLPAAAPVPAPAPAAAPASPAGRPADRGGTALMRELGSLMTEPSLTSDEVRVLAEAVAIAARF